MESNDNNNDKSGVTTADHRGKFSSLCAHPHMPPVFPLPAHTRLTVNLHRGECTVTSIVSQSQKTAGDVGLVLFFRGWNTVSPFHRCRYQILFAGVLDVLYMRDTHSSTYVRLTDMAAAGAFCLSGPQGELESEQKCSTESCNLQRECAALSGRHTSTALSLQHLNSTLVVEHIGTGLRVAPAFIYKPNRTSGNFAFSW